MPLRPVTLAAHAALISGAEDSHPFARAEKLAGSHQARSARAKDQDIGWMQKRHRAIRKRRRRPEAAPSALPRDQSPCPLGMNWKSSTGTCSKNALCSPCGKGHRTGVDCWLVYQF